MLAGFNAAGQQPLVGGLLVFLGVASWALYTIGSRAIMERIPALTVNWTTLFAATLFQIPLLWTDQKAIAAGFASVALSDWLALAYLVVFATAIAQQAWLFGVKNIGPSRASVMGNLTPVAAVAPTGRKVRSVPGWCIVKLLPESLPTSSSRWDGLLHRHHGDPASKSGGNLHCRPFHSNRRIDEMRVC